MTPVAVQSVAPAKGMKACACCNTSTSGIAAAADNVGATSLTAVARTAPCALVLLNSYAVSSQAQEELLLTLRVCLTR